jgi:hypothetical protein
MKTTLSIQELDQRIHLIKKQLLALGDLRPGSLTRQYNVCGKPHCRCKDPEEPRRHGPYYQLSYVHQGKSTSRFIRTAYLPAVRSQLATYRRFRRLTDQWVALAVRKAESLLKTSRWENPSGRGHSGQQIP